MWKLGQIKPGDKIQFHHVTHDVAVKLETILENTIEDIKYQRYTQKVLIMRRLKDGTEHIIDTRDINQDQLKVTYRQLGDKCILITYGNEEIDLNISFRIHHLSQLIRGKQLSGIIDLAPSGNSLMVQYDINVITHNELIDVLFKCECQLTDLPQVKSRIFHLPIAFEDSATIESIERYTRSFKKTAPWLPSNLEFVRRINGLNSKVEVQKIICSASYIILGLGDVYLGSPCAVPLDPRHRLMSSKYSPARTYTAGEIVGLGGVYMCIYAMHGSPGGYQMVGRTVPIWDQESKNKMFNKNQPWLFNCFDQIQYFQVSEDELLATHAQFRQGKMELKIEDSWFDIKAYNTFLQENKNSIDSFKDKQAYAFNAEAAFWKRDIES